MLRSKRGDSVGRQEPRDPAQPGHFCSSGGAAARSSQVTVNISDPLYSVPRSWHILRLCYKALQPLVKARETLSTVLIIALVFMEGGTTGMNRWLLCRIFFPLKVSHPSLPIPTCGPPFPIQNRQIR